jgi:hypothetical protein
MYCVACVACVCVSERRIWNRNVVGVKTRTLIIVVLIFVVFAISIEIGPSPIEDGRFALLGLLLGVGASDNVEKRLLLLPTRVHGLCWSSPDQFGGSSMRLSNQET